MWRWKCFLALWQIHVSFNYIGAHQDFQVTEFFMPEVLIEELCLYIESMLNKYHSIKNIFLIFFFLFWQIWKTWNIYCTCNKHTNISITLGLARLTDSIAATRSNRRQDKTIMFKKLCFLYIYTVQFRTININNRLRKKKL